MKAASAALLTLVALLAWAAPAAAQPVLVAVERPWHYWLSVVLMASFVGLMGLLALGYVVRVVMAKYGVRVGRR